MIDNGPVTDYNYEEKLEKNYKDIPNKAHSPTKKMEVVMNTDYMETSKNFWLSHEGGKYFPTYNEGIMVGTFNARQPTFSATAETFMEALKNVIRIQCEKEDKTPEELTKYIELIQQSFNLLADKLESTLDERMSGEMLMAYIQATFNSFITTNIKPKE